MRSAMLCLSLMLLLGQRTPKESWSYRSFTSDFERIAVLLQHFASERSHTLCVQFASLLGIAFCGRTRADFWNQL
jgi:hypothetical protein